MMPLKRIDLDRQLEPLIWCVDKLILQGYINTIASLPGEGKTALLTGLAWQLSRSEGEFLERKVTQGTSIYVDFDAPGDGRTLRYWLEKHKASFPDGDESKIIVLEPDGETYGLSEDELVDLTDIAKKSNAKLILIDSFSSAFPNIDPNKLVQVQGPLWYLRRLAIETGAAVVIIDHLPKPVSGERAGARGIIGSIAKSAQARAVHILSRVPTLKTSGKTLLRWDTNKMSYAARPEPFGVELSFDEKSVIIQLTELPQGHGETRTQRGLRALQNHLEAKRGKVIYHQDLLDIAMLKANLRKRAAANVIRLLKQHYGEELNVSILPGRGKPHGYSLPLLDPEGKEATSLHQTKETPLDKDKALLQHPEQQIDPNAIKEGQHEADVAPTQKA